MAFHFSLETIFHFRKSVELQQKLRLRTANQQLARVRHLLDQLDSRIREMHARQAQDLAAGATAAELIFALQCQAGMSQQRPAIERELLRLQNLRDVQQKIFHQARRDREVLESLRDSQLRDYECDQRRREQRSLDDLFLMRQAYLRRG
jgi:flagellar export protein FliJ